MNNTVLYRLCFAVLSALFTLSTSAKEPAAFKDGKWVDLFNKLDLDGWEVIDYAGHAETKVEKEEMIINFGEELTGVRYTNEILTMMGTPKEIPEGAPTTVRFVGQHPTGGDLWVDTNGDQYRFTPGPDDESIPEDTGPEAVN